MIHRSAWSRVYWDLYRNMLVFTAKTASRTSPASTFGRFRVRLQSRHDDVTHCRCRRSRSISGTIFLISLLGVRPARAGEETSPSLRALVRLRRPFVAGAGEATATPFQRPRTPDEFPRLELYGGYAFLEFPDASQSYPLGWVGSAAYNLKRWLGVVGEVSGSYSSEEVPGVGSASSSIHSFLGGSRLSMRRQGLTPFFEALFGVTRTDLSGTVGPFSVGAARTDFTVQAGLGADFPVTETMAVRATVDFRTLYAGDESLGQTRFTTGLVYRMHPTGGLGERRREPEPSRRRAPAPGEFPPLEFSAAYAFLRDGEDFDLPLGWAASAAKNLRPWLGVVGDVSGSYRTDEGVRYNIHTFLGGARLSLRRRTLSPYGEALFGLSRSSVSFDQGSIPGFETGSSSDFAYQFGAGVDIRWRPGLAFRTGLDLRNIAAPEGTATQVRFIAGVVFGSAPSAERTEPPEPDYQPPPPPEPPPPEPAVPERTAPTEPTQPPPPPPPARERQQPEPRPGALQRATALLVEGNHFQAANEFLAYVRQNAMNKFTIRIGLYCELDNVTRQVVESSASPQLFVLPAEFEGRQCYRVVWGVYDSQADAQRGLSTVPSAIRAPGQIPVPLARLLP